MSDEAKLDVGLSGFEPALACLPYLLNTGVTETAHALGMHYFDLTEDVPTIKAIMEMAKISNGPTRITAAVAAAHPNNLTGDQS